MRPPASGMWRLEQNDESGVADAEPQSILTRFAEHVSASTSRDPGIFQGRGHKSPESGKNSRIGPIEYTPRNNLYRNLRCY